MVVSELLDEQTLVPEFCACLDFRKAALKLEENVPIIRDLTLIN